MNELTDTLTIFSNDNSHVSTSPITLQVTGTLLYDNKPVGDTVDYEIIITFYDSTVQPTECDVETIDYYISNTASTKVYDIVCDPNGGVCNPSSQTKESSISPSVPTSGATCDI